MPVKIYLLLESKSNKIKSKRRNDSIASKMRKVVNEMEEDLLVVVTSAGITCPPDTLATSESSVVTERTAFGDCLFTVLVWWLIIIGIIGGFTGGTIGGVT